VLECLGTSLFFAQNMTDARLSEFKFFLDSVFNACVEEALYDHLQTTIKWLADQESSQPTVHTLNSEDSDFKSNHPSMIRACKKKDIQIVFLLYRTGFRVHTSLVEIASMAINDDNKDLMLELVRLEAIANPIYLLAEHKYQEEDRKVDPVNRAFSLIMVCNTLASNKKSFMNKIEDITDVLSRFIVKMLDLCEGTSDVELFLNQVRDSSLFCFFNPAKAQDVGIQITESEI
jgi:hypothetical protein